jgi:hypothetical protein
MYKSLQTFNETTERLWLEVEDQIARPFIWTAAAVKANRAVAEVPRQSPVELSDDELTDKPRNPLRRWRWV